jgi:hypothetical protein
MVGRATPIARTYPRGVTSRFGTWLAGGAAAAPSATKADETDTRYPGERYGLPAEGVGQVASLWKRLVALVVDCVLASLVTSLFVRQDFIHHPQTNNYWSLLTWFLITVIGTSFFAATPGMTLFGLRVARVDGASYVYPLRAAVRAALVALVIPAVVWDFDRRGLHDKAAGTIVVSIR